MPEWASGPVKKTSGHQVRAREQEKPPDHLIRDLPLLGGLGHFAIEIGSGLVALSGPAQ